MSCTEELRQLEVHYAVIERAEQIISQHWTWPAVHGLDEVLRHLAETRLHLIAMSEIDYTASPAPDGGSHRGHSVLT